MNRFVDVKEVGGNICSIAGEEDDPHQHISDRFGVSV